MNKLRMLVALALLVVTASCTGLVGDEAGAPNMEDQAGPDSAPVSPEDDDKSTFAVDIDTASYEYARETINNGRLPEPDDIRPEEFVNAFRQDYTQPDGDGFTVSADGTKTPDWYGDSDEPTHLMRIGLQTREEPADERKDTRLTFVIDTSGSMSGYLEMVQEALHILVDQLHSGDAVAIVTYSDEAGVLSPMTPVTDKAALHAAIDDLAIDGSTNLEDGFVTGYQVARDGFDADATNRVILLSDGMANVGNTEDAPILEQVREEAAAGIALLCVGVGQNYGDELMEQLADNGDGFAVYFSTETQARKLFVEQLPATLAVRAKDAKVQVTFDTDNVETYRLIGFDNRAIEDDEFTDDSVDGGEVGPGHQVTALYAVRLADGASGALGTVDVRWLDPGSGDASQESLPIDVADVDVDAERGSDRFGVDLVAACFAELLRGDERVGDVSFGDLAEVAEALADATEDAEVAELAELIHAAGDLAP